LFVHWEKGVEMFSFELDKLFRKDIQPENLISVKAIPVNRPWREQQISTWAPFVRPKGGTWGTSRLNFGRQFGLLKGSISLFFFKSPKTIALHYTRRHLARYRLETLLKLKIRNSVAWVCERTTSTERLPLVGEVSANFCGKRVPRGQRDGSLGPYSRFSRKPVTTSVGYNIKCKFEARSRQLQVFYLYIYTSIYSLASG
jgi:hypothetical protein